MTITEKDINLLYERLDKQAKSIETLKQTISTPTVPIYDPANFPQDAIEGQIALGTDIKAYKYQSGAWSQIGGGLSYQHATYKATPFGINAGANIPHMSVTSQLGGPTLIDFTTDPTTPAVLTAGYYIFGCDFRQVIALGGTGTAGRSYQAYVNALSTVGGGSTSNNIFVYPTAGTGYLPEIYVQTPLAQMAVGDGFSLVIKNSDSASRVFDSPQIDVIKLS